MTWNRFLGAVGTPLPLKRFFIFDTTYKENLALEYCWDKKDGLFLSLEFRRIKITGAIFPVLREHVSNLFGGDRDVFVKFTKLNLERGSTITFYVSGEKLLIGEAKVKHTERLIPYVAWSRYKDRIFLDEEEYNKYVRVSPISKEERKMGKVTVFELENARKYERPIRSIYPVTSSGRYLTKEMIDKIRSLSMRASG